MLSIAIIIIGLIPAFYLLFGVIFDYLGANPVETLLNESGFWGLRFLLITLAISPLKKLFNINLMPQRRIFGLLSFLYVMIHFWIYIILDRYLDFNEIINDIFERPYITVGFLAFLGLIPLAITSNKAMMRALKKRWVQLHRLVYIIAILAVLHYSWAVKLDLREPLIYITILSILLLIRMILYFKRQIWKQQ